MSKREQPNRDGPCRKGRPGVSKDRSKSTRRNATCQEILDVFLEAKRGVVIGDKDLILQTRCEDVREGLDASSNDLQVGGAASSVNECQVCYGIAQRDEHHETVTQRERTY